MISVAVLGCGYWGPNLLRNFAESSAFRLVACADADPTRFERLTWRYPGVCFTTDYERLLQDTTIDAVAIATPADTHYPLAYQALQNGHHTLVEKPLAIRTAHVEALMALAAEKRLTLMADHTFVYSGAVQKMRQMAEGGELGDIHYFDSVRINLGVFRHDVNVLWDLAPHDVAIMDYVLRKTPSAVSASGSAHIDPAVIDVAYVALHFDDAMLAHCHCNWLAPVKVRTIIVGGSKRLMLYDDSEPSEKIKIYDRGIDGCTVNDVYKKLVQYRLGDMWAPKLETKEALSAVCEHFADCIMTGREPITGGRAGLVVARVLEAAERSLAADSRKVPL